MINEQIVAKIKAGENIGENMALLYEQVKAFIHIVAIRFQGQAELEDLEQEGYLALYPAIDNYDPDRGVKFLSYAEYYIRQRMQRYIQMNGSSMRLSVHEQEKIRQYKRFCNQFALAQGREPTDLEASKGLGYPVYKIAEIRRDASISRVKSLDSTIPEDDEITIGDMVASEEDLEAEALERYDQEKLQAVIWPLVDSLPGKQAPVIRMRYKENLSLKETGDRIGVTIEAARQWERKALTGLRRSSKVRQLRSFLPETAESAAYRGTGAGSFQRTWTSSTERVALDLLERSESLDELLDRLEDSEFLLYK